MNRNNGHWMLSHVGLAPGLIFVTALLLSVLSIPEAKGAPVTQMSGTVEKERSWSAQWVGPAVLTGGNLKGSSWIWYPEAEADAVKATRYFRRVVLMPSAIRSGMATMAADNSATLFINGKEAAKSSQHTHAVTFDIASLLRPGTNVLAVQATNVKGPAGVLLRIEASLQDGSSVVVVSDGQWKSSRQEDKDWMTASFVDASWKAANVQAEAGKGAWGQIQQGAFIPNAWTCYRKSFDLTRKPKTALARIAVDSRYWLWVNGKMVVFEGGLKRGPTPNDTYYDSVDLAPYLVAGHNTLAVLHWFWGIDGFSHKNSGRSGLVFEMDANGTLIRSDKTWKMLVHPAYSTATGKQPNFRISEQPVHFDAQADIGDWTAARFDDAAWQNSKEFGVPPVAPWNQLRLRPIPFWKDYGLKDYANAGALPSESTGERIVAKLPYNAQVTPWLKIDAPAGLLIDMETDNALSEMHVEYVTRQGVQEFEGLAWMNGHAMIYYMPKGVKILGLKYRETGYNTEFTGTFTSDEAFYNTLWTKCQRTLYVTMRDNYMDCPDRERAQWWGDAVNEIGEAFYALSPSSALLARKAIYNLMEWQRADHSIFSPVPAGNWDKELPTQMLASVGKYGFWTYYLYTGDAQTIVDVYPRVRDYLSIWKIDDQGLVVHRAGEWDWEDWGENIDARVLDNAWFCLALEGAANMAEVAGHADHAKAYRAQRESIIKAVNQHFWNGKAYRDPKYTQATDDRANGLAVVAGIVTPDKYPAIKAVLAKEFHASPYMEKYVLEAYALMGDTQAAMDRMKLRFTEIVASPITTIPELFPRGGTDNHAWSGGPLTVLSQYIMGMAPDKVAFEQFHVLPQMGALKSIQSVVPTVKGDIPLAVKREANRFELKITVPKGAVAQIGIPQEKGRRMVRVEANGKTAWALDETPKAVKGVAFQTVDEGYCRFTAMPGKWRFEAIYE